MAGLRPFVALPGRDAESAAGLRTEVVAAGARYTVDDKSYEMDASVFPTFHFLLSDEDQWDAFTPRFVLDYTPSDDSLI